MKLRLAKGAMSEDKADSRVLGGAKVSLEASSLWVNTNRDAHVDIHFTSAADAEFLYENLLWLASVVERAIKKCPIACLGSSELENTGDRVGLTRVKDLEDECNLLSFSQVD